MDRRTFSFWAVLAGLALGFIGNLFFLGRTLGLAFPIYAVLVIAVVLAFQRTDKPLNRRNLWPLLPLLFFAFMVAVRADTLITLLDVLAVLALGGLALYYLPLAAPLDEEPLSDQMQHTLIAGLALLPYGAGEVSGAWAWLRENRRHGGQIGLVIRGLALAAPVLLVFALLLSSADTIFASYIGQLWDALRRAFGLQYTVDTFWRLLFTGMLALLSAGAVAFAWQRSTGSAPQRRYVVVGDQVSEMPALSEDDAFRDDESAGKGKRKPGFKLSLIESGIVLGSVVLLFTAFVGIQFAYLFGGEQNIAAGLTYANYARRGFFELVAVSGLTLTMALWLDRVTVRQGARENTLFRGLALALAALTGVLLVSANRRMLLYEEAYGFTQLRVYTHVFMHWLGVLFGVFALALFRVRKNVFSFGALLCIIGCLATLNLMNVDAYIAERNIARYHAGQKLDIAFLNTLSVDAAPAVAALYHGTDDPAVREWSGQWLIRKLRALDGLQAGAGGSIFSAHVSRAAAFSLLDSQRETLPEYDYNSYWNDQGYFGYDWDVVITAEPGRR